MAKVLLVGAGRRTEMVQLFQKKGCEVHCYEMGDYQPVSKICKVIQGKKWGVKCQRDIFHLLDNYDIVLPFMDAAIVDLAEILEHNPQYKNKIVVSPLESARICYNKKEFEKWMIDNFYDYYPVLNDIYGKRVDKPVCGYGSNDIIFYDGGYPIEEDGRILQQYVDGDEYTVDCYVNKVGQCVGAVPRLREKVANGEILNGRTVANLSLIHKTGVIAEYLNLRGPACFQWIVEEKTNNPYLIEVNARFGGGSPLSIVAGFDTPQYCIDEYILNDLVTSVHWKSDVVMRRTFQSTFFNTEEKVYMS